jgi:hypothetical protein
MDEVSNMKQILKKDCNRLTILVKYVLSFRKQQNRRPRKRVYKYQFI